MSQPFPSPTEIQPETQIPASRIMRERNEARGEVAWFRALLGAALGMRDRLKAENEVLLRRLDATVSEANSQKRTRDLTLERIAQAHKAENAALLQFVRDIWEEIETAKEPSIDVIRDTLHAFVLENGKACDICGGTAEVVDEIMVGNPGAFLGYSTARIAGSCAHCVGGRGPQ